MIEFLQGLPFLPVLLFVFLVFGIVVPLAMVANGRDNNNNVDADGVSKFGLMSERRDL